jgi:hypothetical protein
MSHEGSADDGDIRTSIPATVLPVFSIELCVGYGLRTQGSVINE